MVSGRSSVLRSGDKGQLSTLDLVQHVEQAKERHAAAAQHQRLDKPDIIAADGILRRKVMVAIEERHPLMDDHGAPGTICRPC